MKQHRILIATDVPFWRKSTGAQTRISSLVGFLCSESFVVRTFYLGQTGSEQFTEKDQQLISNQQLDVAQQSSELPPKSWSGKISRYASQILPNIVADSGQSDLPESSLPPGSTEALCLGDFRWPWAQQAFSESIGEFKPDSILIEYVKLSYLIDELTSQQRNSIHCVIDTHDALHIRCEKFKQRGLKHWIEISREEEARELDKFDIVMAIQPEEAKLFRQMAPQAKTIVCGHALANPALIHRSVSQPVVDSTTGQKKKLTIGYLASTNGSNIQAIQAFIDSVWQPLNKELADQKNQQAKTDQTIDTPQLELVIGGSICDVVAKQKLADANIRLLGHVKELADFYDLVDIVINPVEFGTGLKIKSVEGLAFGKPLISTPEGVIGLVGPSVDDSVDSERLSQLPNSALNSAIIVCETADRFLWELKQLLANPELLAGFKNAAINNAGTVSSQSLFSPQKAYSTLKQCLLRGK